MASCSPATMSVPPNGGVAPIRWSAARTAAYCVVRACSTQALPPLWPPSENVTTPIRVDSGLAVSTKRRAAVTWASRIDGPLIPKGGTKMASGLPPMDAGARVLPDVSMTMTTSKAAAGRAGVSVRPVTVAAGWVSTAPSRGSSNCTSGVCAVAMAANAAKTTARSTSGRTSGPRAVHRGDRHPSEGSLVDLVQLATNQAAGLVVRHGGEPAVLPELLVARHAAVGPEVTPRQHPVAG